MTPAQLETIHKAAFTQTRPWSAAEFSSFLESPLCFLVSDDESFALGRVIGPEVELLTLAVHPVTQGKGLGRKCLKQFEHTAFQKGARECFLEVAASNAPAINLYKTNGYTKISERTQYYETVDGTRINALIFRKALSF